MRCLSIFATAMALSATPLLALAQTPPAQASSASAPQQSADAQRGYKLFMADGCYECHGSVGQGGAAAPRIAPNPPDLSAIKSYIRNPAGEMPPFSPKVLDDQGVADIHAYLASIPAPPALASIPLLNQQH